MRSEHSAVNEQQQQQRQQQQQMLLLLHAELQHGETINNRIMLSA